MADPFEQAYAQGTDPFEAAYAEKPTATSDPFEAAYAAPNPADHFEAAYAQPQPPDYSWYNPARLVPTAARIAAPVVGQALGALATPLVGPEAIPIGGAIGGFAGDVGGQLIEQATGQRPSLSLGQALSEGAIGALPGASLTRSGRTIAGVGKEALRAGALGVTATGISTLGREGRLPTAGEAAVGAGLGVGAGALGAAVEGFRPHGVPGATGAEDFTFARTDAPEMAKIGPRQTYQINQGNQPVGTLKLQLNNVGEGLGEGGAPATYTADLSDFKGDTNSYVKLLRNLNDEFNITNVESAAKPTGGGIVSGGPIERNYRKFLARFAPEALSPEAGVTQETFSQHLAGAKRDTYDLLRSPDWQAAQATADAMPQADQLSFAQRIEAGDRFPDNPALAKMADTYRAATQPRGLALRDALPEGKVGYFSNYLSPLFSDPQAAEKAFTHEMQSNFPTLPTFTKEKVLTLNEALEFARKNGLELNTTNPFRWVEQRLAQEDKFLALVNSVKDPRVERQLAPWGESMRSLPAGLAPIDPRAAQALGVQNMVATEPIAKIINNHFAPDTLSRAAATATGVAASLNRMRVAIDLFHGMRTLSSTMAHGVGEGLGMMIRGGDLATKGEGAYTALTSMSPLEIYRANKIGGEFYQALDKARIGDGTSPLIEQALMGGMAPELELARTFVGHMKNILSNPEHSLPTNVGDALLQLSSAPVMRGIVPRMKIGAYLLNLQRELKIQNPQTQEEMASIAQSVRKALDNSMGHMSQDNLGFSQTMARMMRVFIGFPSWNIGKFRGYAGVARGAAQIFGGQEVDREATQQLQFAAGVVLTHLAAGALLHKTLTGAWPESPTDFYAPKTGAKLPDGTDERVYLPTFLVDAVRLARSPGKTLGAKESPYLQIGSEILRNADSMGIQIRDPEASGFAQIPQVAEYAAKQASPFFFRQALSEDPRMGSSLGPIAGTLGITKAGAYLSRSPAQQEAADAISRELSARGPIPREQADRTRARGDLRTAIRAPGADVVGQLSDAEAQGLISKREGRTFQRGVSADPFVERVNALSAPDFVKVWQQANPEERQKLQAVARKKIVRARVMGDVRALQAYQAAGIR